MDKYFFKCSFRSLLFNGIVQNPLSEGSNENQKPYMTTNSTEAGNISYAVIDTKSYECI